MQYFVNFVSPGNAKADIGCSGKLDSHFIASCFRHIGVKIILLSSDNLSLSYSQKSLGCFF